MISIYWVIQVAFDILLLILLLSVLKSRGKDRLNREVSSSSSDESLTEDDGLLHMMELQETLESLISQVEKITQRSLEQLHGLIEDAEDSRIVLEKKVESARQALQALEQLMPHTGAEDSVSVQEGPDTDETKVEKILRLHRHGDSVEQIAKQLSIGRGEVHLVLDLHRTGQEK